MRATSFLKYHAYHTKYINSKQSPVDFYKRPKSLTTLKAFTEIEGFVPNVQGFELKAA